MLNVRLTLRTDDGHLVYMRYEGMRHGPAWVIEQLNKGEKVDPNQYYFRTTPWFETASEKYRFLNRIVCVATGRRDPAGPRAAWRSSHRTARILRAHTRL
jgi:hypothetical protein